MLQGEWNERNDTSDDPVPCHLQHLLRRFHPTGGKWMQVVCWKLISRSVDSQGQTLIIVDQQVLSWLPILHLSQSRHSRGVYC